MLGITGTSSNKSHLISGGVLREGAKFNYTIDEKVKLNLKESIPVDTFLSIQNNYDTLGGDTLSNRSRSTDSSPVRTF